MKADATANDDYWIDLTVGGSSGEIIWYNYGSEISRTPTPATGVNAPADTTSFKLSSTDGGEVYAIEGHTTNPVSTYVVFDTSSVTVPEGADDITRLELKNALSNAMAAVNDSVTSNGQTLSQLLNGITSLNNTATDSNNSLKEILGEIRSSMTPNLPTMPQAPNLADNKPNMPTTAFTDDTVYFEDKGDTAHQVTALPTAPEPENWQDSDGNIITPDIEMETDPEQVIDPVMTQDLELVQDTELTQSPVLEQDSVFEIDTEFQQTETYSLDPVMEQSTEMQQTEFYEQSPVDDTLPRWRSN